MLILWGAVIERGFSTQNWPTFRQALGLGAMFARVSMARQFSMPTTLCPMRNVSEPCAMETNPRLRFLKRFTMFNTDQCEDLPREAVSAPSPVPEGLMVPQAEALIAATGADFRIGGYRSK